VTATPGELRDRGQPRLHRTSRAMATTFGSPTKVSCSPTPRKLGDGKPHACLTPGDMNGVNDFHSPGRHRVRASVVGIAGVDDSCCHTDAAYTAICGLSCLANTSALFWQSGGQGRAVAAAACWWNGYGRAGGHRLFTANDREPTGTVRFSSGGSG
jgi:hypothetical protein